MHIEYLPFGSLDCPLVRILGFTAAQAQLLSDAVAELTDGTLERFRLAERTGAAPVDGFDLSFAVGNADGGLICTAPFPEWILTAESWENVLGLIKPFARGASGYQWLSRIGGTSLLISGDGSW